MSTRRTMSVALAVIAIALAVFFLLRRPAPPRQMELTEMAARFMTIVPEDVTEAQKTEIEGLLKRFLAKARADQIRPEDYQEVMQLLAAHVTRGTIDRQELNIFMAKVGYYSYRAQSPDSSDIHPLLSPIDEPTDTVP